MIDSTVEGRTLSKLQQDVLEGIDRSVARPPVVGIKNIINAPTIVGSTGEPLCHCCGTQLLQQIQERGREIETDTDEDQNHPMWWTRRLLKLKQCTMCEDHHCMRCSECEQPDPKLLGLDSIDLWFYCKTCQWTMNKRGEIPIKEGVLNATEIAANFKFDDAAMQMLTKREQKPTQNDDDDDDEIPERPRLKAQVEQPKNTKCNTRPCTWTAVYECPWCNKPFCEKPSCIATVTLG